MNKDYIQNLFLKEFQKYHIRPETLRWKLKSMFHFWEDLKEVKKLNNRAIKTVRRPNSEF